MGIALFEVNLGRFPQGDCQVSDKSKNISKTYNDL